MNQTEKLEDFKISDKNGILKIEYIGSNPNIDKCSNHLLDKHATYNLIKTLLENQAKPL